ncbi:anaphase-promoting complex subunit 13 [Dendrobium catenatum]|uniref:anaphase-promoting complex subunit 13 n=1 Tax=Dendrobium catenatum TaxID=906689 RepID=UPI0009F2DA94|nr:anaphase-promoting complex subunit 13 [Dendrobium catenatum]XP_028551387.1 anaphase-promoting complex subunit 13 [Dendrobium catenatum]
MADAAELLSPGILIDIVDDEWMRETLPKDDVPLPSGMAPRIDDAGDSTGQENLLVEGDVWRDLGLDRSL